MDNPAPKAILGDMETHSDIVIVGGGLNGPALALALAQHGLRSVVIDALPADVRNDDTFDGRGYALSHSSVNLLRAIHIWPEVSENAQPITHVQVSDGKPGQGAGPFPVEFDEAELDSGHLGQMVEDRFLRHALLDAIAAHPLITTLQGTVSAQDTSDTAVVTLTNGDTVRGKVLVGCDGRASGTCARAGIKRTGWSYGQTALVCAIAHERPHNGTAHQFFLPSGPLAILPLPGNQSSIVWTETDDNAARIMSMSDEEYLSILRPRFGAFLGQISLAGKRFSYPLNITIANRFVTNRVALVGDAAHGMHPIAGQGLNAGLKDVAALAEVLVLAHRRGEDIGMINVLERYQQWRRFDTATLALATDTFNKMFSNDNPLLRAARDIGMGIVNGLPGLRRTAMRESAGLIGDLPLLLQGRAI